MSRLDPEARPVVVIVLIGIGIGFGLLAWILATGL